jgi:hypothetical protein
MTGLLAGPVKDAADLDAGRAEAADLDAGRAGHCREAGPGTRPRVAADQPMRPGLAEPGPPRR